MIVLAPKLEMELKDIIATEVEAFSVTVRVLGKQIDVKIPKYRMVQAVFNEVENEILSKLSNNE